MNEIMWNIMLTGLITFLPMLLIIRMFPDPDQLSDRVKYPVVFVLAAGLTMFFLGALGSIWAG